MKATSPACRAGIRAATALLFITHRGITRRRVITHHRRATTGPARVTVDVLAMAGVPGMAAVTGTVAEAAITAAVPVIAHRRRLPGQDPAAVAGIATTVGEAVLRREGRQVETSARMAISDAAGTVARAAGIAKANDNGALGSAVFSG